MADIGWDWLGLAGIGRGIESANLIGSRFDRIGLRLIGFRLETESVPSDYLLIGFGVGDVLLEGVGGLDGVGGRSV